MKVVWTSHKFQLLDYLREVLGPKMVDICNKHVIFVIFWEAGLEYSQRKFH